MAKFGRLLLVAVTFGAVFVARLLHVQFRGPVGGVGSYVVFAGVLCIVALAVGLPTAQDDWQPAIFASVLAALVGTAIAALGRVFVPDLLPRFVLLVVPALLIPAYVACWRMVDRSVHRQRGRERVLAVLEVADIDALRQDTDRDFPLPEEQYTLVETIEPGAATDGRLLELVEQHQITLVVLGSSAQFVDVIVEQAETMHRQGVRIRTLEMFYDEWLGKLALSDVGRMALLTDIGAMHDRQYASLKRIIDIGFALLGCVALVVVVPFVWIANLFANRGPLLFIQIRTGLNDGHFRILKFRTMTQHDQPRDRALAHAWTSEGDLRITPFGRLLRRTHLDELPQVLNVLRGSLSIVGPRPEQAVYVAELEAKLPYYSLRHAVKPGITGWAQVKFRYGASEQDAFEKLQYDLYYVRHQSLVFDLKTISRTIRQVLFGMGR